MKEQGINLAGILGIVFIVLKLTKIINWSWLWVLAPFWVVPSILLFIVAPILYLTYLFTK